MERVLQNACCGRFSFFRTGFLACQLLLTNKTCFSNGQRIPAPMLYSPLRDLMADFDGDLCAKKDTWRWHVSKQFPQFCHLSHPLALIGWFDNLQLVTVVTPFQFNPSQHHPWVFQKKLQARSNAKSTSQVPAEAIGECNIALVDTQYCTCEVQYCTW